MLNDITLDKVLIFLSK